MFKNLVSTRFIAPLFILLEIVGLLLIYRDYDNRISNFKSSRIQFLQNQYHATLKSYSLLTNTIFEEVLDQLDVLSLVKRADDAKNEQAKAIVRGQLFVKLNDTYQRLADRNFRQLHFHLPNGESLIRFHIPSKFGDNLFKTRPSIRFVNTAKVKVEGYEEGPGGPGFRYVFPLNFQGTHIGSVELGVSFEALRSSMEKLYAPETFSFLIKKQIVDQTLFPDEAKKYSVSELSKDYVHGPEDSESVPFSKLLGLSHDAASKLINQIKSQAGSIIAQGKSFCVGITANDQDYVVTFIPVFNIGGKQAAYIFSIIRDPSFASRWRDLILKWLAFSLFLLAFFALVFVSERSREKLAEQNRQIEKQTYRLQNITDNMAEALYVVDRAGVITFLNPAAENLMTSPASQMLGQKLDTFVQIQHDQDGSLVIEQDTALEAMEKGIKVSEEANMKILGASQAFQVFLTSAPIVEHGAITGAVTVIEDVTERKKTEMELRRSEIRLRSVVHNALDAIITVDAQGRIETFNPSAESVFGFSRDEVFGQNARILMPEPYASSFEEFVTKALLLDAPKPFSQKTEIIARHKDGSTFPVELSISEIRLGATKMLLGIIRDISERKRFERELISARERAEQASKAKSEFLANMSHEIRTPMNGIIGMTQLALETNLTPEQRDYLSTVKSSSELLLKLINDILDFSKIEAGKLEIDRVDFEFRDTLADTMRALALQAEEKGLELLFQVAEDVPDNLYGDPARIRQIIVNLVGNAIKFTESGEIVAGAELWNTEGNRVTIHFCISDTGIGISQEKIQKIFQPFDQADTSTTRRYGGTGLGLSISSRLVEIMDGQIWVDSKLGQGSKFHFTIQLDVSRAEIQGKHPAPIEALEGVRVLIVDDNLTNRKILDGQLSNWGMSAALAQSGVDTIAIMKTFASKQTPFAVALIDCMMPEMDGFQLASIIKNSPELNKTKLVMLSSAAQVGDAEERKRFGLEAWLVKPVKQSELLTCLLTILGDTYDPKSAALQEDQKEIASSVHHKKAKILLAEDNVINRTFAIRLLEKAGHTVVCVENGQEVLDLMETEKFDLILMDVSMPEMDGYEATRRIRSAEKETSRHIPIIAMTAHALMEDRGRCLEAGMDDYISKPVNTKELFQKIDIYASASVEPKA
ncbi:MAG: response regulator [Desulfomonilaceae bacterium]